MFKKKDEKNKDEHDPTSEHDETEEETEESETEGDEGTESAEESEEGIDYDEELAKLEGEGAEDGTEGDAPNKEQKDKKPKTHRSELEKATYTAKNTLKRIKELGGDPKAVFAEVDTDTSEEDDEPSQQPEQSGKYVTKHDLALTLAQQEAEKLARSPGELKLMMWYVKNKKLSVKDAHFMANKGRIEKTLGEVQRKERTVPANHGGGAGQKVVKGNVPELSPQAKVAVQSSNMIYDPKKKAYVGKKTQLRYDEKAKIWVSERLPKA